MPYSCKDTFDHKWLINAVTILVASLIFAVINERNITIGLIILQAMLSGIIAIPATAFVDWLICDGKTTQ